IWPNTAVYTQGFWSAPTLDGENVKVSATFPPLGAAPKAANLTFGYNGAGKINHITLEIIPQAPPTPSDKISDVVRGMINNALANGTPMSVAYVNEDNQPVLSLRGSIQVYGDLQLCAWIRSTEGGLAKSLEKNPNIAMLYRDSKTRSTLLIQGRGHFDPDSAVRQLVFDIVPEVERNHDPLMEKGGALIIEVDRIQGGSVAGPVRVQRPA
ncbi:MAG: pyridoxamine 5'-phosphate oxidase family protein, partial [Chloroflexota bacterium]